jgi:hypothetical protein
VCLGWRQTGGCEGRGAREPRGDRDCATTVQRDWSGFCSCGNGVETAHTNCHHATFTCQEKCDAIAQHAPAGAKVIPGATADCVGWHQTGGCSASGEREPSGDATCATMVQGGWSGYCQCTGSIKTQRSNCHHQPFRCDTACEKAVKADKASKAAARENSLSASDKAKRAARRETERVAAAAGQAELAAKAAQKAEASAAKATEEASALKARVAQAAESSAAALAAAQEEERAALAARDAAEAKSALAAAAAASAMEAAAGLEEADAARLAAAAADRQRVAVANAAALAAAAVASAAEAELAQSGGGDPASDPRYGDARIKELTELAMSNDPMVADEAIQSLRAAQRARKAAEAAAATAQTTAVGATAAAVAARAAADATAKAHADIEAEVAAADEARAAESLSGAQVSVFYLPLHLTRIMLTI